jgi:hypothetical protein
MATKLPGNKNLLIHFLIAVLSQACHGRPCPNPSRLRFLCMQRPKIFIMRGLTLHEHTAMTGEKRDCIARELAANSPHGTATLVAKICCLIPGKKIVQSWRSSEFPDDAPDSVLIYSARSRTRALLKSILNTKIFRSGQAAAIPGRLDRLLCKPHAEIFCSTG